VIFPTRWERGGMVSIDNELVVILRRDEAKRYKG
jgi:hypothetical protein